LKSVGVRLRRIGRPSRADTPKGQALRRLPPTRTRATAARYVPAVARDRHRAAWEDWGRIDPFWAILTEADARHGRWDVDRFFATGVEQVAAMLAHTKRYGRPARRGAALDFGCGLGRLTRALAPHFERTYELDVASTMIERAQRLDTGFGRSGAVFVRHDRENLSRYASGSVDFLSCLLVLQHLPSRDAIEAYLREFVRVLSPGGVAVVQLPVRVPPADDSYVRLRTRGARLLRAVGGVKPEDPLRAARLGAGDAHVRHPLRRDGHDLRDRGWAAARRVTRERASRRCGEPYVLRCAARRRAAGRSN
jgi:SAM-dependent methyltransferase